MSLSSVVAAMVLAAAAPPESIRVAAVQMGSTFNIERNLEKHVEYIADCAARGVRVVVFPECALTGYGTGPDVYDNLTAVEIRRAEKRICRAARENDVYAVVGSALKVGDETFNAAFVTDPDGKIIERYAKVQLAGERWAAQGRWLSLFEIDGVPCSIIICHDERYPELVRVPALKGARIIFYISDESNVRLENKLAYALEATQIEIRFYHTHRYPEPPLVPYPDLDDNRNDFTVEFMSNELGWQDPITVKVKHQLALLPGPGRLLARWVRRPDGSHDTVAEMIGRVGKVYVYPLEASATMGNEGEKSVIPYQYRETSLIPDEYPAY